jgi:hypothetical protein
MPTRKKKFDAASYFDCLAESMKEEETGEGEPAAAYAVPEEGTQIQVQGMSGRPISLRRKMKASETIDTLRAEVKLVALGDFPDDKPMYKSGVLLKEGSWTLAEYGIIGRLQLIMVTGKVIGGSSLPDDAPDYEMPHAFKPLKYPLMKTCRKPDDLMCIEHPLDPRVLAPCGKHRFTGETYYNLAKMMLRDDTSTHTLRCPMSACAVEIPFDFLCKAAMLTDEEIRFFLLHIESRAMASKACPCPTCKRLCERPERLDYTRVNCGKSGCRDFCFSCGGLWKGSGFQVCGSTSCATYEVQKTLEMAPIIKVTGEHECPSIRACPKCLSTVEWKRGCKHVTCPGCKFYFCFLCLKEAKSECTVPRYSEMCALAPRQVIR